jgi:hypothetical protein
MTIQGTVPIPRRGGTVLPRAHRWVAAALVEVGRGDNDRRAEHAARTGRYVVPAATRIDVLEVYCAECRAPYRPCAATSECPGPHPAPGRDPRPVLRAVR